MNRRHTGFTAPSRHNATRQKQMINQAFEAVRAHVLRNPLLQESLRKEKDETAFVARVVEAGQHAGFVFTGTDVIDAMRANRRAWLERWLF